MNFLAHVYLSGQDEQKAIGNFIADSVRGKQYLEFSKGIQHGILLHREIDTYTDAHPIWRKDKKLLVPVYNHYAAVIIDLYYDHFLAKNWAAYHEIPLATYAANFYDTLQVNFDMLPTKIQNFLSIMIRENWFTCYETIEGLGYILQQMDRRTKGISKMTQATRELAEHYEVLERDFTHFFKELEEYVAFVQKTPRFTSI
ncbi:acyl carrier protein phosphodiesterase [Myroides fluvii]|uniref:acyl carrier protein phosphodiesterase n=1 Tax=Myroides fluvii TaxID=2572594 RepID=UPI00131DF927|nr:acyl carrier protein phosphodiesterase [Myroides fluvii]